jgi:Zn finger protein HypA/HybF involved in hydrogenase expression
MSASVERFEAVQAALRCPACGGQRRYAADAGKLICESCGARFDIVDDGTLEPRRETAYDAELHDAEPPEIDHAHRCEACGGEVMFVGHAVSDRCPYCDGPVVLGGGQAQFLPSAVIPFQIAQRQAEAAIAAWVAARWAAPSHLTQTVAKGHIAAVYAPFWTFDSHHAIDYRARKRVGHGKNARWRTVHGTTKLELDDTLTAASDHVTPEIRDGIMHGFSLELLKPYLPDYLAGFAAELHGQSVSEGLAKMRKDIEVLVHRNIRRAEGQVKDISYSSRMSSVRFRRVLLPLWIHHYVINGKPMRIVVSGIDGRTFGQRPFSFAKLLGFSAAIVVPLFLIGIVIGAVLAP